jgi:cellulose biosynthesis protein BcsQ
MAPESAWAQPPTAPLPIIKPQSAPPAKPSAPRAPLGVPHQVPPAPMPRPADDLVRRRTEPRPEPPAEMGLQGAVRRSTFGLISPPPGRREQERHAEMELVQSRFGGLRQVTVANPAHGSGKSVAAQLLALTFGEHRDEPVLAWDTGETADLSPQGAFDLLVTEGSTLDFGARRDALSDSYRLVVVGTGTDPDTPQWRAAIDATDQLVVAIFGSNDSAEAAARMLNYLERMGRVRVARQAVTVLALPQNQRDIDAPGIEHHFAARTRAVVRIPYDRAVEARPIDYRQLSDATRAAWLKAAAAVAEGL